MKDIVSVIFFLVTYTANAYVYESEDVVKELGLVEHRNVINCPFYPAKKMRRIFYFNPKEIEYEISLNEATNKLGSDEYSKKQVKCLQESYKDGDKILQFLKKTSQSKEHGFLLIREGAIIAIAYMVAIYV